MDKSGIWIRRALSSLLLIFACAAWTQAGAESVEAKLQPDDAPNEFVHTKSMAAGLALAPVSVDLGEWVGSKAAPVGNVPIIGVSRQSAKTATVQALASLLQWRPTAQGGWVAAISVRSGGADGLRLGVLVDQLPGSAMLRLYTDDRREAVFEIAGQRVLQIVQANLDAGDNSADGHTWWAPSSSGEQVTLEIELPSGTPTSALRVAVPRVMHIYENLSLPMAGESETIGRSLPCQQDVNCQGGAYDMQRRAVARTSYVSGSYIRLCTGTLLNDKASSGTPYFLTANHCVSTQTAASSLETTWFYWSSSCGSASLSSSSQVLRMGAKLLYSSRDPDVTLLSLNDTPPAGAVFAGWDSSYRSVGDTVVGIHHPRGDLQKFSLGRMSARANCVQTADGFSCRAPVDGSYYYVDWSLGLTEQGSSGSPLFFNGRVSGTLSGGPTTLSCGSKNYGVYASFSSVFDALKQWIYQDSSIAAVVRTPVYRFYNMQNGTHFFTANTAERDAIVANLPNYRYENVAFYAAAQAQNGLSGVYRFFNTGSSSHFYTINESERDYVRANLPGFNYEGTVWWASKTYGNGMVAVYRFYNTATGAHFYTTSPMERDAVIDNLKQFNFEGTAYYVWNSQ